MSKLGLRKLPFHSYLASGNEATFEQGSTDRMGCALKEFFQRHSVWSSDQCLHCMLLTRYWSVGDDRKRLETFKAT